MNLKCYIVTYGEHDLLTYDRLAQVCLAVTTLADDQMELKIKRDLPVSQRLIWIL